MQNVGQNGCQDLCKDVKYVDAGQASMTPSSISSVMENVQLLTGISEQQNFIELSASEEEEVSEVESFILDQEELDDGESVLDTSKFLLASENLDGTDLRSVDPETEAKLEALLEAAGIGKLSTADGKAFADPEVLRRLTSSVSCALDEAAQALTRMRAEQQGESVRSLAEACSDGDINTVRKLLDEGRSVHETTEEGESLLSLACSAGYYELAQVLLAMRANVEDRGIKGDCTPLMEAASGGHVDIVRLLIDHGADVNAQSSAGNTPLHYAACGGYEEVVMALLMAGANEEEHNENGHTPLMEAASAGHVDVARTLLKAGAGINTHSNEFKESALTLACYKGHLQMVKFLLEEGADQEHKTDEMHTALMEASMDGHVEVARLLLDSGAQVNMPADSFESPLTLAACGGHVELANLLIERGANLEEVNDEGYTPLMEAAREGHDEMVALLLAHGADINAQTEETQETALTLACCGGFQEVAEFLIKAGADLELGCSTPLMEAAQEGHLDLVKFLIDEVAKVNAQTGTGDTALTYACENGHTDVADVLLKAGADLEHESEGGRTPLMKAARAGHLCTVQFLISKGADVNRQTSTNDHTVLSLACAGGHMAVVELLLTHGADPTHKLKDGSTMLIEAAKGGHTSVVNLLLEWPNNVLSPPPDLTQITPPDHSNINELPRVPMQGLNNIVPPQDPDQIPCPSALPVNLHTGQYLDQIPCPSALPINLHTGLTTVPGQLNLKDLNIPPRSTEQIRQNMQKSLLRHKLPPKDGELKKQNNLPISMPTLISAPAPSPALLTAPSFNVPMTMPLPLPAASTAMVPMSFPVSLPAMMPQSFVEAAEAPLSLDTEGFDFEKALADSTLGSGEGELKLDAKTSEKCEKLEAFINNMMRKAELLNTTREEQIVKKQQILEELQKVERELHEKAQAQLLFNFQQRLEQSQLAMPAVAPLNQAQLQQLQQQQQRLEALQQQAGAAVAPPLLQVPLPTLPPMQPLQPITLPMLSQDTLADTLKKNSRNAEMSLESAGSGAHGSEASSHLVVSTPPPPPVREKKKAKRSLKPHSQQSPPQGVLINTSMPPETSPFKAASSSEGASSGPSAESSPTHNGAGSEAASPAKAVALAAGAGEQKRGSRASSEEVDLSSVAPAPSESMQTMAKQARVECPGASASSSAMSAPPTLSQVASTLPAIQWDPSALQKLQALPLPTVLTTTAGAASFFDPQQLAKAESALQFAQLTAEQTRTNYTIQQVQADYQHKLQLQEYQAQIDAHQQLQQHVAMTLGHQQQQQVVTATASQLQLHHDLQAKFSLANQMTQVQPLVPCGLTQQELLAQTQQLQQLQVTSDMWLKQQPPRTLQPQLPVSHAGHKQAFTLAGQQLAPLIPPQAPIAQPLQANLTQSIAPAPPKKAKKKLGPLTQPILQPAVPLISPQYSPAGLDTITPPPSTPLTPNPSPVSPVLGQSSSLELDAQTESNHDTALTFACAGGHNDLVTLLLSRGADIEHRDKKGFTPLILAATAGHADVVEILLDHGADIEAQSERTKDTPLSLACSGGRYEVVEFLLARGANKEHRNVSDYTPLSLAASGGYVNIIKLLLSHGAEINSRTGSKLGISPLMLAAMNGHTAAVRLLLDMGSDINAQIETNRNTALTLACFQGRHEVVSLLVDRKANIEHRAKTGLTPLMEAASGGYVEVGRVLLDKVADVNAPPVPSSRDTALTIAADKGHYRFVELLLERGAAVDVKNKKGNSPLWLACNGGHLDVVQLLVNAHADVDSQDNRKVSCLMASFRKGHVKVVKWLVKHVTQFPSDPECMRYIATITDKELLKKCHQCMEILVSAKDRQAAQANKNASILLEELDLEKSREESKKAALARKRERRRRKKKEKQEKEQREREEKTKEEEETDKPSENGSKNSSPEPDDDKEDDDEPDEPEPEPEPPRVAVTPEPPPIKEPEVAPSHSRPSGRNASKRAKNEANASVSSEAGSKSRNKKNKRAEKEREKEREREKEKEKERENQTQIDHEKSLETRLETRVPVGHSVTVNPNPCVNTGPSASTHSTPNSKKNRSKENLAASGIGELDDFGSMPNTLRNSPRDKDKNTKERLCKVNSLESFNMPPMLSPLKNNNGLKSPGLTSPKRGQKTEEGWKEVTRKPVNFRSKKVMVPSSAVSRVIGRGGSNINAIREVSGAHIELEKQKGAGDRAIMIKGSAEAIKQAHTLISALVRDPEKELDQLLPKAKQKPVGSATTSCNTFSSNMWHNSMANNIPASTNVGTLGTGSAPGTPSMPRAQPVKSTASASWSISVPSTAAPLMGPFANVVKQNGTSTTVVAPMVGSPKKIGAGMMKTTGPPSGPGMQAFSSPNPVDGKSPGSVVRELFPKEPSASQPVGTNGNKTTLTYCTSAMTATKVVTSCSPSFAAKVDNRTLMATQGQQQLQQLHLQQQSQHPPQVRPPGKPVINAAPPGMRPDMQNISPRSSAAPVHPNSAPNMMAAPLRPAMPPGTHPSIPHPASIGAPDFSPFNNRLSGVAERVMGKKEDFASIVAAGVIPTTASNMMPMGPPPTESKSDPSLEARAPGYKAVGQRTSSPQMNEAELAKAPGYRGNTGGPLGNLSGPLGPAGCPAGMYPGGVSLLESSRAMLQQHASYMQTMANMQRNVQFEAAPGRAPGFKPGAPPSGEMMDHASRAPGYRSVLQQAELSPRSAANPAGMGMTMGQLLDNRPVQEEYSTPHQPMTLPKIESTLNPNAPDFTSRTPDFPSRSPLLQHQLLLQQYQGLGGNFQINLAPGSGPSTGMHAPPIPNNSAFVGMPDNWQAFLNTAVMSAQANAPRQVSPGPPGAPPTGLQNRPSSSPTNSPIPASTSEPCPASGSAPSPTNGSPCMNNGEDRRFPHPIGTGRAARKVGNTSGPSEGSAVQQFWPFPECMDGMDWLSNPGMASVTTVLATTVVTSSVVSAACISQDSEPRPASLPAVIGPHLLPGGYGADPGLDPSMDAHLQLLQRQTLLLANSNAPQAAVLTNGLPPSANASNSRNLFAPPTMAGENTLPSGWPQTNLKASPDAKLTWNNWNNAGNL